MQVAVNNLTHAVPLATFMFMFLACAVGACATGPQAPSPPAVQTPYRDGVPHTDRIGAPRSTFDARQSFFPIGLYHALLGEFGGRTYDLRQLGEAGFNTIVPWGGQPLETVLAAARANRLQVIWQDPTDAEAKAYGNDPALFGWAVDHEPSVDEPGPSAEARLQKFVERRAQLRGLSRRPVFTVNSPSISGDRADLWKQWADAGDIASFWKYPFFSPPVRTLTGERGLPEVTRLAVSATHERKPVLYVAQAFRGQSLRWFFPDTAQARGMVYAAIVHGATGIIWFGLDSFVLRNDDVIGASPSPAPDYGISLPDRRAAAPPRRATLEEVEESRRMWNTMRTLNAELAALAPVFLSATADEPYSVISLGESANAVHTLLKATDDGLVLLAVNVQGAPVSARFQFERPVAGLERLRDTDPAPSTDRGEWDDTFPPFGVRIYRLRL